MSLCASLPNAELENLYTLSEATLKLKLHFVLLCACLVSVHTTKAKKSVVKASVSRLIINIFNFIMFKTPYLYISLYS